MKGIIRFLAIAMCAVVALVACGKETTDDGKDSGALKSVKLTPSSYTFEDIGKTLTLRVAVSPTGYSLDCMTFESSNEAVATVNQDGIVTSVGNGEATITGTLEGRKATCKITVKQVIRPTSIKIISPATDQTFAPGDEVEVKCEILPEDATNKDFTITVKDSDFAKIDGHKVKFLEYGGLSSLTVTANGDDSVTDFIFFGIKVPATGVDIEGASGNDIYVEVGGEFPVNVNVLPLTTNNSGHSVSLEFTNNSFAKLENSTLYGIAEGTCTITVVYFDDNSLNRTFTVHVIKNLNKVSVNGEEPVSYVPGTLSSVLGKYAKVTSLKWTGPSTMEGKDVDALKNDNVYLYLKSMDFEKVSFVASDNLYRDWNNSQPSQKTKDKQIPYGFLRGYKSLESVVLSNTATFIDGNALGYCSSLKTVSFPASIEEIQQSAFYSAGLEGTLTIPATLKKLNPSAFSYTKIARVVFEGKETTGWYNPFENCMDLEEIIVPEGSSHYSSKDGCLCEKNGKQLACFPGKKMTGTLQLPDGIETIGNNSMSFRKAEINDFVIPEGITTLEGYSLSYYHNNTLTMPSTMKTIDSSCMFECSITKLIVNATVPPVFIGSTQYAPFYRPKVECTEICVPAESVEAYKNATGWSNCASIIKAIE